MAAEPDAAAQIVGFCGRLPLAIRVAGARLAARPGRPLVRLVELLADERRRLDQLAAGDLEVRASLVLSYRALSGTQQRALRLLGALEVGDFSAWLAGPLLGVAHDQAETLVEELADAQLLELAAVDPTGPTATGSTTWSGCTPGNARPPRTARTSGGWRWRG